MALLNNFHSGTADLQRINKAYLALLPKKATSLLPKDFRPISLQNCVTKICTKGMTMRLQPVVTYLLHSDQTGFIKGRCIAENLLYAAEIVQCCHKRKAKAIALKLEFRKAFDSVDWGCLDSILAAKGFPPLWHRWIHLLNTSGQTAVVLNGVPGKWIQCKRGLRQGDPLSPYLFIIVADLLLQMIAKASSQRQLEHPLVADLPCPVLQYADDTLIVLKAVPEQVACLRSLLDSFASATGLHINYDKSTFVPIGLDQQEATDMAALMGCTVDSFPQTYLGLPLATHKLRLHDFSPLVSAIDNYIPGWCGKTLTPSGRTILANVVLGNRAVYAMCSTLLLKGTIEAVDARRRAFIWTGDTTCNGGQCKAAWDTVCRDKDRGGLGVKNLALQNRSLLSKFWSKLHQSSTTSWQHWFLRCYGPAAGRDLGDAHYLDTPTWSMLLQVLPDFRRCTRTIIGDGASTSFWFDHWIGPQPLADMFPALLSHTTRPNITVLGTWNGLTWNLFTSHRISSVALAELQVVQQALNNVHLDTNVTDQRGVGDRLLPFSSATSYAWYMAQSPIDDFATFIWSNAAIPRCKHFLWLIHHDRLPSAALLHRRNIVESALCSYCGHHEDQLHILLQCPRARQAWRLLHWPQVPYLASFHDLWSMPQLPDAHPKMRSAVITAILWNIWKARNAFVFEGKFVAPQHVLAAARADLLLWAHRLPQAARPDFLLVIDSVFVT